MYVTILFVQYVRSITSHEGVGDYYPVLAFLFGIRLLLITHDVQERLRIPDFPGGGYYVP